LGAWIETVDLRQIQSADLPLPPCGGLRQDAPPGEGEFIVKVIVKIKEHREELVHVR
jgi:hypothetical protein